MKMTEEAMEAQSEYPNPDEKHPVTSANASLKQKTFQHTPHDFTIKRAEQRNVETLALAEAMGEWVSALLKDEQRAVRGSEGFFEDVANGVVLCKVLQKLGIPVEKPKDPPRNEFDVKENRLKFQRACKKAGFTSVPAIDYSDPTVGLLPALIECAAIDEAQKKRQKTTSIVPAAITKRTGEAARSAAVQHALDGTTVPLSSNASETTVPAAIPAVVTPVVSEPTVRDRVASSGAAVDDTNSRPTRARTVSKEEAVRTHRTRTASEIPKDEKDQIVNLAIVGFIIVLILLYLLSQWT